jgi:hypothetical protein
MRQQEQQQRRLTQNGCVDMCQGTPVDPEQYGMPEAASFGQQENVDRTAGHALPQPTNHPRTNTEDVTHCLWVWPAAPCQYTLPAVLQ